MYYDVVNNDSGLLPSVVTLAPMEDKMTAANGIAGDVLALETVRRSSLCVPSSGQTLVGGDSPGYNIFIIGTTFI